jgi:type II secretory pathway pseudopilin PulG
VTLPCGKLQQQLARQWLLQQQQQQRRQCQHQTFPVTIQCAVLLLCTCICPQVTTAAWIASVM